MDIEWAKVGAGIDSISVGPDSLLRVKEHVAAAEADANRVGERLHKKLCIDSPRNEHY